MSSRLDAELIFTDLKPKLAELINQYQHENIYALVIAEGVVYIHTDVGFETTVKGYAEWWEEDNKPVESWAQLEQVAEKTINSGDELRGVADRKTRKAYRGVELLSDEQKADILERINDERRENREGNTYRSEEGREQVRHNIGDWDTKYAIALYPMRGYDEGAYGDHYELSDEQQLVSEYGLAMKALLKLIVESELIQQAKLSEDFYYRTQEHNY